MTFQPHMQNRISGFSVIGPVDHTILAGIDYRHYKLKDLQGFAFAAPVDVVNPVYSNVYPALFYYNNNTTTQERNMSRVAVTRIPASTATAGK